MSKRIILVTFFAFLMDCAVADPSIERSSYERGLINTERTELRDRPTLSALIKMTIPYGSWVSASHETKSQDARIWRRIIVMGPGDGRAEQRTGWIVDEAVTLVSQFKRVSSWKESHIAINRQDRIDHYHFRPDGSFMLRHLACEGIYCGENRVHDLCEPPKERRNDNCIAEGSMFQKGDLVILKFKANQALVDHFYVKGKNTICKWSASPGLSDVCSKNTP